ncbi:MAG: hypothetical protein HOD63_12225 [Bacteroidetes bacterium]|jgi:hypothetical protein|nr:hypothetical protein [Bacteroidota bacterium]MBT5529401.1 hypothetical protein [Cytophagia bacterium]MBT3801365.1 hypothetical protein [Bacteroidota bacterium]MBT3934781.1 hypothetical protein [Bacteroidota bacterium]MBT4339350.1 hypothetical protein [Bacteroidota bacterium]
MATVDNIRNGLIEKILTIRNKKFLLALDNLISSNSANDEVFELTHEQILMLKISEEDIQSGRTVSEEELKYKTNAWLKNKKS